MKPSKIKVKLVSIYDAAEALGCTRAQIYQAIRSGFVKTVYVKGMLRIPEAELQHLEVRNGALLPVGFISVKEAAKTLDISRKTMLKFIKKDAVDYKKVGKRYFIERQSLLTLIKGGETECNK